MGNSIACGWGGDVRVKVVSVEIVTAWYNEAFLAPLFLRHYAFADRITILYDLDTTDDTRAIAADFPNVSLIPFRFPHKFDNMMKQRLINHQYHKSCCDFVLGVDADEFVFYKDASGGLCWDLPAWLRQYDTHDVFYVRLYSVYPHRDDVPLNRDLPAVPQRRHGDPDVPSGFCKPALIRAGLKANWWVGCHKLIVDPAARVAESPVPLLGAHWNKADQALALRRILRDRVERLSVNDVKHNFCTHYYYVTEKKLLHEFAQHADDPLLF